MPRFAIVILILLISVRCLAADSLTDEGMFPTDRVLQVEIKVAEDDWESLCEQSRNFQRAFTARRQFEPPKSPYTYFPARVRIDGVDLGEVGIRKKGFLGSLSDSRPSLKIKLNFVNKRGRIGGLKNLTMNNNQQDTTLMSQFLGYRFYNAVGSPAPRCAYAKVTINGKNLGVYSHVETPRKAFLKREFGNSSGQFYEGTVTDFYPDWEKSFELESGDEDAGRAHLLQAIAALQTPRGNALVSLKSTGRALVPLDNRLGQTWTASDFDDSAWIAGRNGAGYDRQDDYQEFLSDEFNFLDAMYKKSPSVYLRFPFEIEDLAAVKAAEELGLRIRYDDGFVVWLNGHRVAAVNAPDELAWDSVATANSNEAKGFEFISIAQHRDKLRVGRNVLAIHGMNASRLNSDMLIACELETRQKSLLNDRIAEVFDIDAFYRFWTVESLLGFWDGYCANRNNYFTYWNPRTKKFHFVPWGGDCMFEKYSMIELRQPGPNCVKNLGLVPLRLYQTPQGRSRFAATLSELLKRHWKEDELLAEIDRIEKLVRPHLSDEQQGTFSPNRIRRFVRARRKDVEAELAGGLPESNRVPQAPPIMDGWWIRSP